MKNIIVAIDGPAGAGKSTVSQIAADKLGFTYIDTGAMYRAVAYKALQQKAEVTDELIISVLPDIEITLKFENAKTKVFADGKEITAEIRTPEINKIVSKVAALVPVREKLTELQRKMGQNENVLMDGRDIGTFVFPNADVKIFLTASVEERARRRYEELKAKGFDVNLKEIEKDIAKRDKLDSEREMAPLKKADDAILLDTTGLSIDEVVEKIITLCENAR
ncbi:MAG: (d)CMP kinase [Selenomonadaceae bacterium]|nr:(d)CMP kinase [Selenomonadaceae bacterium]